MIKTFTPDDLLRYLYKDTSTEETQEIEKALRLDIRLQDQLEQLKADIELLDTLVPEPSESCLNHIMDYARAMNLRAYCN
ncbi:hypothetical protein [Nafulsella turpanensis]|uniref:hypothetical protein n=1 Tax=Nafulsella turpanensis TaxID=1265690 RepID=UPI00034B504F|nr:hypothetical protein [Nafulsella turpanensis]